MTMTLSCAAALGLALILQTGAYLAWRRGARVAWVDVVWAISVGLCGLLMVWTLGQDPLRNAIVSAIIGTWSLRLSLLLRARVRRHQGEDGRYANMLQAFGPRNGRKMIAFYGAQACVGALFALPPGLAAMAEGPLGIFDLWALAIGVIAIVGEGLADRQLAQFRANPANRGQVCRVGLWATSRHPNYFFEWVHWWAYTPLALCAGALVFAFLGPALMFLFLFRISGIPWTERQALASRGEAYAAYQREVSVFFPWPARKPRSPR